MRSTGSSRSLGVWSGRLLLCGVAIGAVGSGTARAGDPAPETKRAATGGEIFHREWMPGDPGGHGGDGLGPVFNDTSCVACHNAGGGGGAGPISKNIDILTASRNGAFNPTKPVATPAASSAEESALEPLITLHAGFKAGRTVVLHKFGTDPGYDAWRSTVLGGGQNQSFLSPNSAIMGQTLFVETLAPGQGQSQSRRDPAAEAAQVRLNQARASIGTVGMNQEIGLGMFVVTRSQRNPTPLFGLGLVDAIPESAIVAIAREQSRRNPAIAGRPARTPEGKVGRLGWKGQTANAEDFVLNACAVEVGLEVPGHPQAMIPQAPRYKPSGLDLSAEECAALVAYVRALPRPVERAPSGEAEAKHLGAGKALFASIGCAGCHVGKLASVEGLYSDLLLHDMGAEMAESGSYGGSSDDGTEEPLLPLLTSGEAQPGQPAQQVQTRAPREPKGARKQEWRTPPLWGFRDSGPYLHDGRAQTLEQAVAMHGGQGAASSQAYFRLSPRERLQVEAFLKSLVAPPAADRELAQAGE